MNEFVTKWLEQEGDDVAAIEDAFTQLSWLQHELLDEYEPHAYVKFADRVDGWLRNFADDADQRAMYRLLPRLFFVGREQMASLGRAAYNDTAHRWVLDQIDIPLIDPDIASKLEVAMQNTWFCPVTDSMKINSFLKLNSLGGHSIRPDWLSLAELGEAERIDAYVKRHKIARLILLEDFVGSGVQMFEAVDFARRTLPDMPILVVPLVCCPGGAKRGREMAESDPLLAFEPVLTLSSDLFVLEEAQQDEPPEFAVARRLSNSLRASFNRNFADPLGWHGTGALVVLHTNCPDNTLPLFHDESDEWAAIFPRISRA